MGAQSVSEKSRTKQLRPGVCVSGGKIIQRDTVNFIPGSGTITAADNPANHTVDVTYTAPTGGLVGAYLQAPNNLSEVVPSIARTNLGLDTFIVTDHNAGTVGATGTIYWATYGGLQHILLTPATPCTLTFIAPSAPCEVFLRVQNPFTSTPAITWPASVTWADNGAQPAVATTAGLYHTYRFIYDGATYWGDVIPKLGTAATYDVGMSGATVPLLNGVNNTWSGAQTWNVNSGVNVAGTTASFSVTTGYSSGLAQVALYNDTAQQGVVSIAGSTNTTYGTASSMIVGTSAANPLVLITNNTARMTITGAGAVSFPAAIGLPGTTAQYVRGDGSIVAFPAGGSPLTTKGDLFGFDTVGNRLPVGTNTQVLTADSTQALGVKWATPASGGTAVELAPASNVVLAPGFSSYKVGYSEVPAGYSSEVGLGAYSEVG